MSDYESISVDTDTNTWVENVDQHVPGVNPVAGITAAPGIGHANTALSSIWSFASGDMSFEGAATQVMATVADLGMGLASLATDPLGTLIGWGVDILVPLIEPLQSLIHEVSGDPDQMRDTAAVWGRIAEADVHISEGVAGTLTPLAEWSTLDGVQARTKIDDIAASVYALSNSCTGAQSLLGAAQALAELIKEAIKWLLSQLIKFFIQVIAPQLAASIATFGATAASAIGLAVAEGANATIKGVKWTQRVMEAFAQLAKAFAEFAKNALPGIVVASLQYSGGSIAPGMPGPGGAPTAGSSDGGAIDPAVLTEISPTFSTISGDMQDVATIVDEAVADEMTWGLCGAMGFASNYSERAQELKQLHSDASDSLTTLATNIEQAGNDWQSADDITADVFKGINSDLTTGG